MVLDCVGMWSVPAWDASEAVQSSLLFSKEEKIFVTSIYVDNSWYHLVNTTGEHHHRYCSPVMLTAHDLRFSLEPCDFFSCVA